MSENFKKGTKFIVCGHEKLMDLGWWEDDDEHYYHDDFQACSITFKMIEENEGKTLTVTGKDPALDNELAVWLWYTVAENKYVWPVSTFIIVSDTNDHACVEGMTPLDGWFFCKICGDNLRTIK